MWPELWLCMSVGKHLQEHLQEAKKVLPGVAAALVRIQLLYGLKVSVQI